MKILIIKPSSFGDIIHANPTLVALKKLYHDSKVSWLVFDSFKDVVSLFPDVDDVIVWERKGGIKEFIRVIYRIRKEKFDLVIDLQGLFRTGLLCFLSGAKEKIGVPGLKELSSFFVREVYPESASLNATERNLETVHYLSREKLEPQFNVKISEDIKNKGKNIIESLDLKPQEILIGFVPFSRGPSKVWPLEYYKELASLCLQEFEMAKIVIMGDKNDSFWLPDHKLKDLCGKTSIHELALVLSKCTAVVGGDTGPVQLAAALDVPVVVIFGGSDVKETAPVTKKVSILHNKNYPCAPCRTSPTCKDYPCLQDIKPQEVLFEVKKWI